MLCDLQFYKQTDTLYLCITLRVSQKQFETTSKTYLNEQGKMVKLESNLK